MTSKKTLWIVLGGAGVCYLILKLARATPTPPEVHFCTLEQYNDFLNDFQGTPEEFIGCCRMVSDWIGEYEGCPVSFSGIYNPESDQIFIECRSNCNGSGYILFDDVFTWTTKEHIFGRPSGHFSYC